MNRLGTLVEKTCLRAPHPEVPHLGLRAQLQRCLAENRASYEYALKHVGAIFRLGAQSSGHGVNQTLITRDQFRPRELFSSHAGSDQVPIGRTHILLIFITW